jgi:carboxylate-amine ligase
MARSPLVEVPWFAPAFRHAFEHERSFTVGLEEEAILLDPESLRPANRIEHVLGRIGGDRRFAREFRQAQLEIITPVAQTVDGACIELAAARTAVTLHAGNDIRLATVGTHPFSTDPVAVTNRERYRRLANECPWATRHGLPSGLHVHVAVDGAERALTIFNAVRSYLPEIAALAANSPFLEGGDTGLASCRLRLNDDFQRSGIPPAFASVTAVEEFLAWGARSNLFLDGSYLWWDLRLHHVHGTLEFRIADAQTRIADVAAIAAVCQCLTALLAARYDAGEPLPVHESHRIMENRWRAVRYGIRGQLADLDSGRAVSTREVIGLLLVELEPFAEELGCTTGLLQAWRLLRTNGAERQREYAARAGLVELTRSLADETESSAAAAASAEAVPAIGIPA